MINSQPTPSQTYFLYGHTIRSAWSLPYVAQADTDLVDYELLAEEKPFATAEMEDVTREMDEAVWFHYARLLDGSDFIRWTGLFDFLVSPDGHRIRGRSCLANPHESFQAYLLGQVLSCAMVRQGIEPLHATVVVIDGRAVAFLGDSGYGKSTLAGSFLRAGFPILTDDMLVLRKVENQFVAYAGPPRIKLFPEMAQAVLAGEVRGTPMNPDTTKLIIPLAQDNLAQTPVPLQAFYALQPPDVHDGDVVILPLSQSQALLAFVQNTFNTVIKGPERLTRQFHHAAELSADVPVRSLSYPRELSFLPRVLDAVLKDIKSLPA